MSENNDNRRRISEDLLEEIDEFDGKDFTEKLLKWKNSSDELSSLIEDTKESLKQAANGQTLSDNDEIRERIDELREQQEDGLSVNDVEDLLENKLNRLVLDQRSGDIRLE